MRIAINYVEDSCVVEVGTEDEVNTAEMTQEEYDEYFDNSDYYNELEI